MNKTICSECGCIVEIVGFNRDDPVLACGHINRALEPKEALELATKQVFSRLDVLVASGRSEDEAICLLNDQMEEEYQEFQAKKRLVSLLNEN